MIKTEEKKEKEEYRINKRHVLIKIQILKYDKSDIQRSL